MTTIQQKPDSCPEQFILKIPEQQADLKELIESSFENDIANQFEDFLNQLRSLYGDKNLDGTLRVIISRSVNGQRLDCFFKGETPAGLTIEDCGIIKPDDTIVEGPVSGGSNQEIYFCESDQLILTDVLSNSPKHSTDWGCWWNSLKSISGDLWGYWTFDSSDVFLLSDGLGNGTNAAVPSREAALIIDELGDSSIDRYVETMHKKLQTTRGAVMFVGRIPHESGRLEYCSIGDISAKVVGESTVKGLVAFNGTVGFGDPKIQVLTLSLEDFKTLVLHSDGVKPPPSEFFNDTYNQNGPVMNAARLLTSFGRVDDDASVATVNLNRNTNTHA